jgi:hypothetical protein
LADNLKGTMMANITHDDEMADFDLILQTGFASQYHGRWQFFVDRHPMSIALSTVALGIISAIGMKLAHDDPSHALMVLAGTLFTTPVLILVPTLRLNRPAHPAYVLAAMRSVARDKRRAFLDQLNTASLRGQFIPSSRSDVLAAAALVRLQITNVFNNYGWLVSNSGGFTYSPSRTFTLSLAADF